MDDDRTKQPSSGRQSLRLAADVWTAIDASRQRRPGNVSRNSWIAEAVFEKLKRENSEVLERD